MRFIRENYLLLVIIFIGIALRLWGLGFGLPYQFHQDEPIIVNHALAYGAGDFNPHFFIIPPLTSYILFFFYGVYFLTLNVFGATKGLETFAISFFKDPTFFYLIGRAAIGLLPSAFNIYLTYRLALKFFSKRAALYSAFLMSVFFLNVVNGHYVYTDNLLVLFILLTYLAMSRLIQRPAAGNYIASAVLIGISVAIKYNSAVLIVPFFVAHFIVNRGRPLRNIVFNCNLLLALVFIPLVFIICNPFSIIDWRFFLLSVTGKIRHCYVGWSHHVIYSMFQGLGIIPTILAIAGFLYAFIKIDKKILFLVAFPVIFYMHLVFASQPFSRYVLALIPFISIILGFFIYDYLYPKLRARVFKIAAILASVAIIMPTAIKSVKADILFSRPDTRAEAAAWIERNIPAFSKIAFDNTSYTPQLKQTKAQLEDKYRIADIQPGLGLLKRKKLGFQLKAIEGGKAYEVYYLGEGSEFAGQFFNLWPIIKNNLAELKKRNIEYVVFNNMTNLESTRQLYTDITNRYKPVAVFNPYKESKFRRPYDEIATTCLPILGKELFSREKNGPYIIIYKIR